MANPIQRKKRSKTRTILLAPLFAIVFLIGWVFYYVGESSNKRQQKTINKTPAQPDNIHLEVISNQEEQIITN